MAMYLFVVKVVESCKARRVTTLRGDCSHDHDVVTKEVPLGTQAPSTLVTNPLFGPPHFQRVGLNPCVATPFLKTAISQI